MKLKRLLIMQLHKVQNKLEQNTVYSVKYNLQLAISGDTWYNINMWHTVTQLTLERHNQHLKGIHVLEIKVPFSKRAKRWYHSTISDSTTVQP